MGQSTLKAKKSKERKQRPVTVPVVQHERPSEKQAVTRQASTQTPCVKTPWCRSPALTTCFCLVTSLLSGSDLTTFLSLLCRVSVLEEHFSAAKTSLVSVLTSAACDMEVSSSSMQVSCSHNLQTLACFLSDISTSFWTLDAEDNVTTAVMLCRSCNVWCCRW